MRNATEQEFNAVNPWKYTARRIVEKRTQDIYYSDCGTEVASKHLFYKRGKVVSTAYFINPVYLKDDANV